jgi:hypothetical protein
MKKAIATADQTEYLEIIASHLRQMRVTHFQRIERLEAARSLFLETRGETETSFAETFSKACGISPSAIRAYIAMGRALHGAVRSRIPALKPTPSRLELLELSRREPADQLDALDTALEYGSLRIALGGATVRRPRSGVRRAGVEVPPEDAPPVAEIPFMQGLMLALGALPGMRIHRQNVGKVVVRDRAGNALRTFDAGPPNGAADISGIVGPEGFRLEVETKSEDGKPSAAQLAWRNMIQAHGGIYVLVTYDASMTLEGNIAYGVVLVNRAIEARRRA